MLTKSCVFDHPDIDLLQTASLPGLSERGNVKRSQSSRGLSWNCRTTTERFNPWVEHVKTALPQISSVRGDGTRRRSSCLPCGDLQRWLRGDLIRLVGRHLAGDGPTILPYLQSRPAVVITEEPENCIHPQAIEAVLQSLGSVYDSQVLISSHSPVVLAISHLDQILCSRVASNGAVTIIKGTDHPRLKEWKGTIDLGSLFAAGCCDRDCVFFTADSTMKQALLGFMTRNDRFVHYNLGTAPFAFDPNRISSRPPQWIPEPTQPVRNC